MLVITNYNEDFPVKSKMCKKMSCTGMTVWIKIVSPQVFVMEKNHIYPPKGIFLGFQMYHHVKSADFSSA